MGFFARWVLALVRNHLRTGAERQAPHFAFQEYERPPPRTSIGGDGCSQMPPPIPGGLAVSEPR